MFRRIVRKKFTDVSEVLNNSIISLVALKMEAESTSETSVNFYQITRRNIPEDRHLRKAFVSILKDGQAHRCQATCSLPQPPFVSQPHNQNFFLVSISFSTEVCDIIRFITLLGGIL
jgi:hypothetical protein